MCGHILWSHALTTHSHTFYIHVHMFWKCHHVFTTHSRSLKHVAMHCKGVTIPSQPFPTPRNALSLCNPFSHLQTHGHSLATHSHVLTMPWQCTTNLHNPFPDVASILPMRSHAFTTHSHALLTLWQCVAMCLKVWLCLCNLFSCLQTCFLALQRHGHLFPCLTCKVILCL